MTSENLGTPEVEEMACMENTAFGLAACVKPRGAGERRACNHPFQIFICTLPRQREIPLAEK